MRPIRFKNTSGETIPPFGVFSQTNVTKNSAGRGFISAAKPGSDTATYAVNGPAAVTDGNPGRGMPIFCAQYVAYDSSTGTPAIGEEWGPVPGNWKVSAKGFGLKIAGIDSANGLLLVDVPVRSGIRVAYAVQSIKNGQKRRVQLRDGFQSGSAGEEVRALNRLFQGKILVGTAMYVSEINGQWEIIQVFPEEESESSSGSGDDSGSDNSISGDSGSGGDSDGSGGSGSDVSGGSSGSGASNSGSFSGSGDSGNSGGSGSGSGSGSGGSGSGSGSGSGGSGGGSGKDSAVVPASWTPGGYTALYVTEAPEVRFDDVMVAEVQEQETKVAMDPRFVEVCEPGSIVVCSCQPNIPVLIGAEASHDHVAIRLGNPCSVRVVVRVSGIRRGFSGVRFPSKTREEFEANERWLSRSTTATEGSRTSRESDDALSSGDSSNE